MKVQITLKWVERNVIPKGCRKPRDVSYVDDVLTDIEIPELTNIPVAIRRHDTLYVDKGNDSVVIEYRWYNGRLFTPVFEHRSTTMVRLSDKVVDGIRWQMQGSGFESGYQWGSRQEALIAKLQHAADHPFIDGIAHEVASEPVLEIVQPGIFSSDRSAWVSVRDHADQGNGNVYSALQWPEVKARLQELQDHGATIHLPTSLVADGSVDLEQMDSPLEVLMPEVIQKDPQAAYKAYRFAADKEYAQQRLEAAKSALEGSDAALTNLGVHTSSPTRFPNMLSRLLDSLDRIIEEVGNVNA